MGDKSAIEWTDATWNPLRGCSRVSAGCMNCYAERVAHRFNGEGAPYEDLTHIVNGKPTWNGKMKLVPSVLEQPLRWTRPRRIFVNSMSDLFHESVTNEYIAAVFAVMASAPQHTFQVLTKRPKRMLEWFRWISSAKYEGDKPAPPRILCGVCLVGLPGAQGFRADSQFSAYIYTSSQAAANMAWPLPNVWLGVSVEDQAAADERIPLLLQTPAAVRWISAEPLLGPLELDQWLAIHKHWKSSDSLPKAPWHPPYPKHWYKRQALVGAGWKCPLHWVVAGGESGPGARPSHPDWFRSLRDQCAAAAVPFLFKQWGEWAPGECISPVARCVQTASWWADKWLFDRENLAREDLHYADEPDLYRIGKKAAGRQLDGALHDEYPQRGAP